MDPIHNIPNVYANVYQIGVGNIGINDSGIRFIANQNIRSNSFRPGSVRQIQTTQIGDVRTYLQYDPSTTILDVPVTQVIGTPIVNMPGCVRVHKENTRGNKNNQLVNDDPKQNTVLCDAGMPYYEPPDYQANQLQWRTITPDQEDDDDKCQGANCNDGGDGGGVGGAAEPDTTTPEPKEDPPCPEQRMPKIGDPTAKGDEKVSGYELQINKNDPSGPKVCVILYEARSVPEQYLPALGTVTTTATIGAVAASSALLAKPLADLLLKVLKPAMKKIVGKVKKMLGQKEKVLSKRERLLRQKEANSAAKAARQLKGN
tara:strand:- start:643 stop:1590 length:948 start_codon:yes stop_codon:yes gene_type:complete